MKRRIEIICRFASTKPLFLMVVLNIKGTNIAYLKPHRAVINEITYLFIDNSNDIFIENLSNKISINELENYIKNSMKKCN